VLKAALDVLSTIPLYAASPILVELHAPIPAIVDDRNILLAVVVISPTFT
jgi:hypothetical protein